MFVVCVCWLLIVVLCLLLVVFVLCVLAVVYCCMLCSVFVVCCRLVVVRCSLCGGCCSFFVVRWLLSVVCVCLSWFVRCALCVVRCLGFERLVLGVLVAVVRCVLFVD